MKLEEKLTKVNDNFSVYMYDNGFMLEISGRNHNEDWATSKIICRDIKELFDLINQIVDYERD